MTKKYGWTKDVLINHIENKEMLIKKIKEYFSTLSNKYTLGVKYT